MYDTIKTETDGAVLILTLNRPDKLNALSPEMREEVKHALTAFNGDPAQRAAVITGAGDRAFCAGQDLAETRSLSEDTAKAWTEAIRDFHYTLLGLDKPLVAAINGIAAGAGIQIALLCDVRVGHAGTRMGQPEVKAGLTSVIGSFLLTESLGRAKSIALSLSGNLVAGDDCYRLGLLDYLVEPDELMSKALEMAEQLGAQPPVAMRLTKERYRETLIPKFDETFEAAARFQKQAYASGEPQQVMAAFLEKRKKAS